MYYYKLCQGCGLYDIGLPMHFFPPLAITVTANDFQEKLCALAVGGSIPTDSTALHVRIEYEGTFISMYNCPRLAELLCDSPPWAPAAGSGKCHKIYSERLRL